MRELYACEHLTQQKCMFYLPKTTEQVLRGKRNQKIRIERIAPLFPRYIFVEVDKSWRFLLSTFGLIGVVMKGEAPAIVQSTTIDNLQARQNDEGLVQLPTKQEVEFVHGQKVTIVHGHLQGYHGLYQGMKSEDRIRVLLDYLGKQTEVILGKSSVQRAFQPA